MEDFYGKIPRTRRGYILGRIRPVVCGGAGFNLTANKNNKASLMDDEEIVDKKADKHNPSQSRFVVPAAGIFLT